ncbi:uncharacterized protein METZ01_LOCUS430787, partial [marine metagenome]
QTKVFQKIKFAHNIFQILNKIWL